MTSPVATTPTPSPGQGRIQWLPGGEALFPAMLAAIHKAQREIRLETYTFDPGRIGDQFRTALVTAAARGVKVQVLVDAVGSWNLPADYFQALAARGGVVRRFNPLHPARFGVRDHRKLLVCDSHVVFIGGSNIADEYDGDGRTKGWCDMGLRLRDPDLARRCARAFDELFALWALDRKPRRQWRALRRPRRGVTRLPQELLLIRPGIGASPYQQFLYRDLKRARTVRIVTPYFLPTKRLRKELIRVLQRGGKVELLLAGQCDVAISQFAARSLYARLLKAGATILEYQPQILHAKLVCLDDRVVYAGSSNFDIRSLDLNYELMLRLDDKTQAAQALQFLQQIRAGSQIITAAAWKNRETWWQRWRNHWSHFLLTRIDPLVALQQYQSIKIKRSA